jgi:RecG-like helicase
MSAGEFTQAACWGGRPVASKIAYAVPRGRVVVVGAVYSTEVLTEHGGVSYLCVLDDGTGELGLRFLGRRSVAGLIVGTRCTVEGTARMEDGRLVVWNPLYRVEPAQPEQGAESEKPPR